MKPRSLLLALLSLCAVLVVGVRAETLAVPTGQSTLPPRPELIPAETQVADVVLVSSALAGLPKDDAWPLRPGEPLRLVYPLAVAAEEVDPYGWRYSDSRGAWRMHAGQDLVAPEGTPVLAMLPGHVVLVEELDGYGLTVVLDHGRGWQTLYAHLLSASVQQGDFLPAATPLGQLGQSGRASGPHLHVELRRRDGDRMLALDPTPLIDQATRLLPVAPPPLQQAQGTTKIGSPSP
ncbi:M23 family metallopeptidase [Synechococcus sp. LA31]|uniref:M23 family metallopeptidase n=1 Tax=Synechococcus sp. LA31 TaxID=2741953 RepID=UPI0020298DE3|nr:M23 family metallopeptidase [Synechococcus sp. LA31]